MKSIVWLYSMSITSVLSLLYAILKGELIGLLASLILWICIGVWFLLQMKGDSQVPHG